MKILSSIIFLVIFCHVNSTSIFHPHGKPVDIIRMTERDWSTEVITETENIESIFLHPEVKDRKVVVLSSAGVYRRGKNFFLDYCLRFLYANVSLFSIFSIKSQFCLPLVPLNKQAETFIRQLAW